MNLHPAEFFGSLISKVFASQILVDLFIHMVFHRWHILLEAKMKEDEGQIEEAASLVQEVQARQVQEKSFTLGQHQHLREKNDNIFF